ncbi:MAG TPA: hypothetical protein VJQ09_06485, partial [Candidatus Limnocylindria bacterium]|nr:hypothetical protein [Candidatus Limnocylindria bacterium]
GRSIAIGLAAAGVTGVVAGSVWSAIFGLAPLIEGEVVARALDGVVAIVTLLVPIAQLAAQPAVPMSLIAALGVAIIHELRERREHAHAHAS